jgi:hypothetical protein
MDQCLVSRPTRRGNKDLAYVNAPKENYIRRIRSESAYPFSCQRKNTNKNMKKAIIILTAIIGTSASAFAADTYVTKDGYVAAVSAEALDKAYNYLRVGDKTALRELESEGQAFALKPGIEVQLMEGGFFTVKIRPIGSTTELYTTAQAIEPKK